MRLPIRAHTGAPASHLSFRDLVSEAIDALIARPGRTALTALGTTIGVATLIATVGLAQTAGNQVVSHFDELAATEVRVEAAASTARGEPTTQLIPFEIEDQLLRLNGTVAAGTMSSVDIEGRLTRSVPLLDPLASHEFSLPVIAISSGLFEVAHAEVLTGRVFDAGHDARGDPVAVLGRNVALQLNIAQVDNAPSVFVGGEQFVVIGILFDAERRPELLNAVIISNTSGVQRFGLTTAQRALIETEIGAAELIRAQAPTALSPNEPDRLRATVPPAAEQLRSAIEEDLNVLLLGLGLIALLAGAVGIANLTLVSVLERTTEIGLRRALGAKRIHIALQFLTESVALGTVAGILGSSMGVISVVGISLRRQWNPILDPALPLSAPLLGAIIGLVAGTYPAWKAARLQPITALRSE